MPSDWSLVICSGGSGGHLFPALAVLEELRRRDHPPQRVVAISTERPIDRQILSAAGVEHVPLAGTGGTPAKHPLRATWAGLRGVQRAASAIRGCPRPVILGMGGFGSVPGVLAGKLCGAPIVLHEQNVPAGRATSWLARLANTICVSFEDTAADLPRGARIVVTGNPVRRETTELASAERSVPDTPSVRDAGTRRTLLILGGSQGSMTINEALARFIVSHAETLSDWQVFHQTGERDAERIRGLYSQHNVRATVAPFFDNLPHLYSQCELAVTRAGATTLAELACAGVPAVLVPFPNSVRDHQLRNAEWYAERNAAEVVEELGPSDQTLAERLGTHLKSLLADAGRRESLREPMRGLGRPTAALLLADVVLATAKGH